MKTFYIAKGNEAQSINWLADNGYPGINFEGRRDHLGKMLRTGLS